MGKIDVDSLHLTPGRLLVMPHEKGREEANFVVSESGREVSSATVIKCGDLPDEFSGLKEGCTIIYERLNSEPYQFMIDGQVVVLRFVLLRDIAAFSKTDN